MNKKFSLFSVHSPTKKSGTVFNQRVIPPDVVNYIMKHLDRKDIKNLNETDRYFRGLIKYDTESTPLPGRLNIYKDSIFNDTLSEIDIENVYQDIIRYKLNFIWNYDVPVYYFCYLDKNLDTQTMQSSPLKEIRVFQGYVHKKDNFTPYPQEDIFDDYYYIRQIYKKRTLKSPFWQNLGFDETVEDYVTTQVMVRNLDHGMVGLDEIYDELIFYFNSLTFKPLVKEYKSETHFRKYAIVRIQ